MVSGGHGSVAINLSIPAVTAATYPEALKKALSSPSRFIHPDTRRVEASVTAADISVPLVGSVDIAAGQTSASITITAIPTGTNRTVTIKLYDTGGTLLAQNSSVVTVSDGTTSPVALTAVPISTNTVMPGPFLSGTYGVALGPADAGKTHIFAFVLPKAGAYTLYFSDNTIPTFPTVYAPDGTLTAATAVSGTMKSFTASVAGTYYVVITVPSGYTSEPQLAVDADIRTSFVGPTFYVDSSIPIIDRKRVFSLNPASGIDTVAAYDVTFSPPAVGSLTTSPTASGITITPQATTFPAQSAAPAAIFTFTDALLGIARSETVAMPIPRTIIYLSTSGTPPSDSLAMGASSLYAAAGALPSTDLGLPVIAASADFSNTETIGITVNFAALVVGGCVESTWTRTAAHGTSTVNLKAATYPALLVNAGGAGTIFDGMNFLQTTPYAVTGVVNTNIIQVSGKSTFRDCIIRMGNLSITPTMTISHIFVYADAELEFDRCSVLGGDVTLNNNTGYSSYIFAIQTAVATVPLTIVNSVICPGNIYYPATGSPCYSRGINITVANSVLNIAGSTISAGNTNSATGILHSNTVYFSSSTPTFRASNNLFLYDITTDAIYNYAIYDSSANVLVCQNNMISCYPADPGLAVIALIASVSYYQTTWPNYVTYGTGNQFSLESALNLTALSPTAAGFVKPSAASALTTGGANLQVTAPGFTLSGDTSGVAFLVDRDGNPRTAPWTIGAYERD